MAQWEHKTDFRHYIQKYSEKSASGETISFSQIDLEEYFKCRYVSLENADTPSVKSVYTEDFAEHDGQRVWSSDNPVYNASELTLTLRWRSDECEDVQEWSGKFAEYVAGKKFEYRDTFRPDKYWQFIFKDSPVVKAEKLFGNLQYRFVSYKLSNFGGKPYKTSQIQNSI